MARKSFWQGLKDFFKDDDAHIITDEEWETMQSEKQPEEEQPLEEGVYWRCPECRHANLEGSIFCSRCGFHPGSFREVLSQLTTEQLRLVLGGSCRYPVQERRLLEEELARRSLADDGEAAAQQLPAEADEKLIGWRCVRCGAQNPQESYFCGKCGDYRD